MQKWGDLLWHDVHTRFYDRLSLGSKYIRVGQKDMMHHKPNLPYKMSRLKGVGTVLWSVI
jgi:hypothetical protein